MKTYTVLANRYGDDEMHTYLVGVFDDVVKAYRAAIAEEYRRGGKYECVVHESVMNQGFHTDIDDVVNWCKNNCLPGSEYELEVMTRMAQDNEEYDGKNREY